MLLQFPTEAFHFRDAREQALERFRFGCRLPVIRQFAIEAEDLGFYVTHCGACNGVTAKLLPMNDVDCELEIDELEAA